MSASRRIVIKKSVSMLTCALPLLFVITGCLSQKAGQELATPRLEYRLQELTDPRPNRVHILRVDIASGRIQLAVAIGADPDGDGPAETALTSPLKLADDPSVLAFVNTNPWASSPDATGKTNWYSYEGQPVDICGLAASRGRIRSAAQPRYPSVWVNPQGRVLLGRHPSGESVVEGIAGFRQIVRDGAVAVPPAGALHPRTALGVNRDGNVMWLVVVDGRQPHYSEGMNLHELGCLMRDLGSWNALNMDGGGSSIMGLAGPDGQLRVMNSPSDRPFGIMRIRPLPMILTVRTKESSR